MSALKWVGFAFAVGVLALRAPATWAAPAQDAPGVAESRPASDAERAAFLAWYRQHANAAPLTAPVVQARRDRADAPWRIHAHLDAAPRRVLRTLCRMQRLTYFYDGQWRAGAPQQFAWHDSATCKTPAHPLVLGQRIPDTDVLALVAREGGLLARARLLFAGNTACASQRAYRYRLAGLDVSAFIDGGEEMATLTYRSDRGTTARVWARRSGESYDPWNVRCP